MLQGTKEGGMYPRDYAHQSVSKGTPRVYVQTASVRGLDGAVHSKPDGGEIFQINVVGKCTNKKKRMSSSFCFFW